MTAAPATPKSTIAATSRPMKLFLSYGRDEYADEARALRDALLSRGHEVWFDEQRLGSGLDWEHSIEKGLSWCDRVVLLMTPHSVRRPDGFCLNEIAKAMELRRTIIPVLLVEVPLGAPTSICRIQYLDWRDAVPAAERVERFERHLGRLCEAIEEDKLDFEGGQQRLQHLLQPIDFDSDIRPHVARFQGRQQLLGGLRGWMQSPAGQQVLWLSAAPGLGKTAVAAQLAHRWPEVVAMHFCVAGHQDKADPARAILSIAYQLSTKLETFRIRLAALDLEREVQKSDAKTLFDNLLARPLSGAMQHPEHPCVVLVDGLDEATDADGRNRLAEVLGEGWGKLPAWLRLLVSSRPEMEISQSLAESAENLQLEADNAEQKADIAQFLNEQLSAIGKPPSPETLRRIVKRSEGAFIYAVRLVEEVKDGRCDPDNPSDLPSGMHQFYLQTFRRRFPNRQSYNAECAPLLALVLAAPEPVPLNVLADATGTEPWEVRLRLQRLGSMLDIKPGTDANRDELDTARFSHASLRSWLTKLDKRTRAPAAGHFTLRPDTAALAKTVLARWDAQTAEGADGPEGFVARSLWTLLQTSKDAAAMDRVALDYSLYWENLRLIRALESAEHAAKVGSQRGSAQGATSEHLAGAAKSSGHLGDVLLALGRSAEALAQYSRSQEFAERLATQDPDNAGWQRDLSGSYNRIGGVLESQGNLAGALEQFHKSHEIAERLATQDPDNAGWQRNLSVSYNQIGGVLESQGNLAGALEQFQKDLVIAERLATQDPDNAGWQRDLSISYNRIGGVLESQGNLAGALEQFHKSHEIAERLATQAPDNAEWQRNLSISYNRIGGVLESQGNLAGALEQFHKFREIAERLATQDPDNAGWQRNLSISYNQIGGVLESQDNLAGALEQFQKDLVIAERLATQDPDNAGWQRDLSGSYNRIGGVLESQGNLAGALEQFHKSHEIAERLATQDPDNAGWQRNLSISYTQIGGVLESQDNLAGALEQFHKGLVIAERIATQDPDNAGWQRNLSGSYDRIGGVLESQGNLAGALAQFRRTNEIVERLTAQHPDNAEWQRELSISYGRIGGVLESEGNLAGALEQFQKGLVSAERLATQDPDNAGWQQDLSISYSRIGGVLESQGNLAGALEQFRKSHEIAERLATQDPDNVEWQRGLSISYSRVGGVLESQDNLAGALEQFRKSHEIADRLATQDPDNAEWQNDLVNTLSLAANVSMALQDFTSAILFLRRAHLIATSLPDYEEKVAEVHQSLGVCLRQSGQYDDARQTLSENLAFRKTHFGYTSAEVASALSALGQTEVLAGNVETGIQWLEKSKAITLEIEPVDEGNLRNIDERLSHARYLLKH